MPEHIEQDSLTLRERAGQLIFPRLGSNMQPPVTVSEDAERIVRLLDRCPVGGLVLFNGALPDLPGVLSDIQSRSAVPLLIASDIERGTGQQVRGATDFPHAMAYGAIERGGEDLLEQSVRVTAREALACGIHIAFAPVADVNQNPKNPIIATRAFGSEPEQVARFVRAYIRAGRSEGLLTTVKHFPGHGNTAEDSHEKLPNVPSSREEMLATDLVPFKAAIDSGVDLIMTAHVAYPSLDPADHPATASRAILHDLLRRELQFEGAVITDSLLMGAMRSRYTDTRAQVSALLNAGVDIFLDPPEPEHYVDAIVAAAEAGELSESRLDDAVSRVIRLKNVLTDRFGAKFFHGPWDRFPLDEIASAESVGFSRHVARQAIRAYKTDHKSLPIEPRGVSAGELLVVLVDPHRSGTTPRAPLAAALSEVYPHASYLEVGADATPELHRDVLYAAEHARHVVVALVVKPAAWREFGLLPNQHRLVISLVDRYPVILVSLGTPHILAYYEKAPVHLCTYSDTRPSQLALVDCLAGREVDLV